MNVQMGTGNLLKAADVASTVIKVGAVVGAAATTVTIPPVVVAVGGGIVAVGVVS